MNRAARSSGRHPGKKLSPWRVLIGVGAAIIVLIGTIGVPTYLSQRQPAVAQVAAPQWFGGYFDVTAADISATATSNGDDDTVVLAFIVAASADDCTPSWGGYYDLAEAGSALDLDRRIDGMRRDGAHVAVSFGGALNTELGVACSSTDELARAYESVVDRYAITTIDIDLEGDNLSDSGAGERRATALADLQRLREASGGALDIWVTLPTATDGLTDEGIAAVRQMLAAGVELAGINAMTMDYGTDLGDSSMADASIDALESVHEQLTSLYRDMRIGLPDGGAWTVMGATPMIGQNDVADEVFTLDDAAVLSDFAQQKNLARLSIWSLNRDRTCGPNYPDVTVVSDSCSGVEQGAQTFADILSEGFDGAAPDTAEQTDPPVAMPDDPATSPYPIWSEDAAYSNDVRVVWNGYVYVAKWWVSGGPQPDDPTQTAESTSWVLVGPVMPDDEPFTLPTVPVGTYPEWDDETIYQKGERVMRDGVPFEAGWWTQGAAPEEGITDHDRSPWEVVW